MNKTAPFLLIFVFISGIFVTVFNPASASELTEDSWNTKKSMSYDRRNFGVVAVEGKIYAIGGDTNNGYVATNERYDTKTDRWTTLKSMPTPRCNFATVEYQGKIYCMGGITVDPGPVVFALLDVNEVYDIATDSWSTKASIPVKAEGFQAHVVDGKIFVVTRNVLYVYDPDTDIWTNEVDIPNVNVAFSVIVDNKIIIGEPIFVQQSRIQQMKILIYDPRIDRWSEGQLGSELVYRYPIAAGVTTGQYAPVRVYISACVEIFDKDGSFVRLDMVNQVYDPINDTWSTANAMPVHRGTLSITVVDDILYAFAGPFYPDGAITEQYIPIGYRNIAYVTPTPSMSVVPSESTPLRPSEPFLNSQSITVILALSIGAATTGLLVYGRKRKKKIHVSSNVNCSFEGEFQKLFEITYNNSVN